MASNSFTVLSNSTSSSKSPSTQKLTSDPTLKAGQNTVTCMYEARINHLWRNVTVQWTKNPKSYSLTIYVENAEPDHTLTIKIDSRPWHFWGKKGNKSFLIDDSYLEIYWDFRSAKFSGSSPEPYSGFYVAVISEDEAVLSLGDWKEKAYKKTRSSPVLGNALMLYKKEHVFGKKSFSTWAKFDSTKREHEIVVESSSSEMWISVDGIVLVHVRNLQWKFRGNERVVINKRRVKVLWDVYEWLFSGEGLKQGLFVFKQGDEEGDSDGEGDEIEEESLGDGSDWSGRSMYYSARSYSRDSQFCLFLYAWKVD